MATGQLLRLVFGPGEQRLLGPNPEGKPGEAGVFLDAVLQEEVTHEADVTEFPVEDGASINDHVIVRPPFYSLVGVVTDTPHRFFTTTYNNPDGAPRSVAAWALLVALFTRAIKFDIKTGFGVKEDMVIRSLRSKKDKSTKYQMRFSASLKQLNIVSTSRPPSEEDELSEGQAATGAGPVKDQGKQPGTAIALGSAAALAVASTLAASS